MDNVTSIKNTSEVEMRLLDALTLFSYIRSSTAKNLEDAGNAIEIVKHLRSVVGEKESFSKDELKADVFVNLTKAQLRLCLDRLETKVKSGTLEIADCEVVIPIIDKFKAVL